MPRLYTRAALGKLFLLFSAVGFLESWYGTFDYPARGRSINWLVPFIEQMTGCYASLLLLVLLITPVVRRVRPDERPLARWLPAHVAAMLLFSLCHTTLLWGSRAIVFPLLGLGAYDYGILPLRYAMELPTDVISTRSTAARCSSCCGRARPARASSRWRSCGPSRPRAAREPHLSAAAALPVQRAECRGRHDLRGRAQGRHHAGAARRYLRSTLRLSSAQQVPLAQEFELLDLYLGIMKARFEDNLRLAVTLEDGVGDALVPQLILQPIVENAIHHGFDPQSARVQVEVSAARSNGSLVLSVRDHGRGIAPEATPRIGLSNTQQRLERLHGAEARVDITNASGGGTEVTIASRTRPAPTSHDPRPRRRR